MKRWYTLHTKPNSEYRVATVLQARDIEVYLPEIVQERRWVPFFPCYLFARVDLNRISASQWQWTPGLHRIVSFGGQPASLPDEIVNLIHHKVDSAKSAGRLTNHFKPGDTVRIKKGPLRGMLATFDGPTEPSQRVRVLLTILGQLNRVRIDAADLERILTESQEIPPKRPRRTRGRGRHIG